MPGSSLHGSQHALCYFFGNNPVIDIWLIALE
jgi:hypothetical protein